MRYRKTIVDSKGETTVVIWDGNNFIIINQKRNSEIETHTTVLDPKQMMDLVSFAGNPKEHIDKIGGMFC